MVSITDVEVTADYAHAKVFFSTLAGSERVAEVLAGLDKAPATFDITSKVVR